MENLTALIDKLRTLSNETEWVEFKHNNFDPDMIGEDISALANGAALNNRPFAYMLWGVHDKTHEVVGTIVDNQSLKIGKQEFDNWVRCMLSDNAEIEFHDAVATNGRRVVVLQISKATTRPISFKKVEYVRVGSYTKKLQDVPSRQTVLWDRLRSSRFENEVAATDLREDQVLRLLDTHAYFNHLDRPYPSTSQGVIRYLVDEELVREDDNGLFLITNAGAMLFARDLGAFAGLKRKKIRISRYFGDNRLSPSRDEVIDAGYAVDFPGTIRLIHAMTPSEEVATKDLREERNGYPDLAIREAVANALIHQDLSVSGTSPTIEIFNNRMEITNPGAPMVDPMRIIDAPPRSRNESSAALMRRMRMCEEKGTGWDKIALSCELSELPAPKIRGYEEGTRVTLYTARPFTQISQDDREWACYMHACLRYVNDNGYMTNSSLRKRFGLGTKSQPVISKLIKRTIEDGLVRPLDPNTSPRYMKYLPSWA